MLALLVAAPANAHRRLRHDHFELSYWPLPVFGEPSVADPTVDTQGSEELFWRYEKQRISVSQRTTTTQVISFSPDRWPIDVAKTSATIPLSGGNGSNGNVPITMRPHSLRLWQRACELKEGQPYRSCYDDEWDLKKDLVQPMFRQVGSAGIKDRERAWELGSALGHEAAQLIQQGQASIHDYVTNSRFGWNDSAEYKCNNHRAVTLPTQYPWAMSINLVPELALEIYWNDAEYAEAILNLTDGSCRWIPKEEHFAQEVTPLPGQLDPGAVNIDPGTWDHFIEVCAYEGDCTEDTFECINNYGVELYSYEEDASPAEEVDLFFHSNVQLPFEGAGDLRQLRLTQDNGPHLPCKVGDDGRQIPCDVPRATPALPTGLTIQASATANQLTPGFSEPEPLVLHVNNLDIKDLTALTFDGFSMRVEYKVAWADRTAVHPCTVPLYHFGAGVPHNGKRVDAANWWWPKPDKDSVSRLTYEHEKNLTVCHGPLPPDAFEPYKNDGCVKVVEACTAQTCPWPKQLFLQDKIKILAQETATWDLFKYPFDKQVVRARIHLVEEDNFESAAAYATTTLNVTLPPEGYFEPDYSDIYKPDAWSVYRAAVVLDPDDPLGLIFELRVQRNAVSTIFKCIIPSIANAFLVMLATTMPTGSRIKVLALSIVAAGAMLNPHFLGLPSDVQGVPFVQSLPIIHMIITFFALAYTGRNMLWDIAYERRRVLAEIKKYHKETTGVWKGVGVKTWKKYVELIQAENGNLDLQFVQGLSVPKDVQVEIAKDTTSARRAVHAQAPESADLPPSAASQTPPVVAEEVVKEPPQQIDWQKALVELLVAMPPLFLRKDPTRPETIWLPWKEPQPQILPNYGKHLKQRKHTDIECIKIFPILFFVAWSLDILIYFAFTPSEPA